VDGGLHGLEECLQSPIGIFRLVTDEVSTRDDEVRPQGIHEGDGLSEDGAGVRAVLPPILLPQDVEVRDVQKREAAVGHAVPSPAGYAGMQVDPRGLRGDERASPRITRG
jgi:hypothetical protein